MIPSKLQTDFYKETGTEAVNSQGEFDLDYVQWLESKVKEQLEVPVTGPTDEETIGQQNLLLEDINTLFNDLETGDCEISDGRSIAIKMIQAAFKLSVTGSKPGKTEEENLEVNQTILDALFFIYPLSIQQITDIFNKYKSYDKTILELKSITNGGSR